MRTRRVLLTFVFLAAALTLNADQASREDAWRADLALFSREFPAAQRDFDTLYPRRQFDADMATIARALPASTDADIVLSLMQLVAGAHVAHTNVRFPSGPGAPAFRRLPLVLAWFADGLAVTAASDPYRAALGLRVVRIGTLTPHQLEAAVAPFVAYENDAWLHYQSPSFMVVTELLRKRGQVDADGRVTLTLAQPDDSTIELRVEPASWQNGPPLTSVIDARQIPLTIHRKDPNRYYRHEFLPDTRTLYIRYSRCANDPQQPFAAFARDVFAAVDADPAAVERVVIDLRFNGGGDSRVIEPLLDGLRARKSISSRGRLYALVGSATFSSGLMAAVSLRQDLKAVLIGEPPGEKPNSYGEVRQLTLPNSRVVVQYSTKFFRLDKNAGSANYEPDVPVKRSIADMLAGRDPVLEAALGHGKR